MLLENKMENQPFFSSKEEASLHLHGEAKGILASHNDAVHRLPFGCSWLSTYQKSLRERRFYLFPSNKEVHRVILINCSVGTM